MKSRAIIGLVLAILAGGGVTGLGLWYFHYRTPMAEEAASDSCAGCTNAGVGSSTAVPLENRVVVYYFHQRQRSDSCLKAEQLTTETLTSTYSAALKSGKLEFKVIDSDSSDFKLFQRDYALPPTALFVMEYKHNQPSRWRVCDKIWLLVNNEASFRNYIVKEVGGYLGA